MKEIKAIVKQALGERVLEALHALPHFPGLTVSECHGQGRGKGPGGTYEVTEAALRSPTYLKIEVFCSDHQVDAIVGAIRSGARTGQPGDGIVMVADLPRVLRIRTGEEQDEAL